MSDITTTSAPTFAPGESYILQALADRVFTNSEDVVGIAVHGLLASPSTGWSLDAAGQPVAPPPPTNPDQTPPADPAIVSLQAQLDAANAQLAAAQGTVTSDGATITANAAQLAAIQAADATELGIDTQETALEQPVATDTPEVAALKAQLLSLGATPAPVPVTPVIDPATGLPIVN